MKKPSEDSPPFKWINIEDFEFICFNLTKQLLEFNEPIPDYSTTDTALLESSLAAPRNSYLLTGASLSQQASILFYSLIKNHPFQNGNKRIAVMTLLVFLHLNEGWLGILPSKLYKIAVLTAKSQAQERDMILQTNAEVFEKYIMEI